MTSISCSCVTTPSPSTSSVWKAGRSAFSPSAKSATALSTIRERKVDWSTLSGLPAGVCEESRSSSSLVTLLPLLPPSLPTGCRASTADCSSPNCRRPSASASSELKSASSSARRCSSPLTIERKRIDSFFGSTPEPNPSPPPPPPSDEGGAANSAMPCSAETSSTYWIMGLTACAVSCWSCGRPLSTRSSVDFIFDSVSDAVSTARATRPMPGR
mmetsp:Transcript_33222/g.87354  ORF Transcript_33222/g.87354 Transcript_33222/m.87354 type:complete len:215 (+) Transcript_33222:791-1435(+)